MVVPAYNYGRFLGDCATSVLTQSDVDVKLLIIDDCSTDDTPAIAAALAAGDPRVAVVRNEPNLGHIPSVNAGLDYVESEYVVKLDADDLLAPGSLARACALMEANPAVGFVYGRPQHFSGAVPKQTGSRPKSWTIWSGRDWLAQRCQTATNAISQPEVVMRTELVRRAGPVRADLPHTSDLHLWLQLASMGDVGRVNGPAQGYYREHGANMQLTVHAGVLFDLRARRDAFDTAFALQESELPDAAELHETAQRTLAASALDRACRAYDRGRTRDQPVADFVEFAIETWPAARSLPQWRALERRVSVGPARAPHHPRFFADALARRASEELSFWRWQRSGEL